MSYSDDERNSVRSSSPVPRGLFSGSDNSGDENEDDRQSRRSGGSPARGRDVNSDEEEERREQEAKRKKEEEKKKKQKAKGPVKRTQIHEEMLIGRNGVSTIPEIFKDFRFGGKGREREDLGKILAKIEHWVHLLHPKHPFDQGLQRMEFLGLKRKVVKTHLKKIRMGMLNEEIVTNEEVVEEGGDDDMEFPNFEGSEMEQDEMRRAMSHQEPSASAAATAQSSEFPNDDFPDDDDILAAMNEGFETVAPAANAQSNQEEEDDFDMDVDMGDETVNVFSRDMELALKRAAMAETQIEKETQLTSVSASDSKIDSSAVSDAVARAFQNSSEVEVENSTVPEALSVPDSEIVSASSSTIDSSAVSDAIARAFQSSGVEFEDLSATEALSVPDPEISASKSLLDTPTLNDSPIVGHSPPSASQERIDETPEVQSEDKTVTETEDNGISLDDLQDADEDEDME